VVIATPGKVSAADAATEAAAAYNAQQAAIAAVQAQQAALAQQQAATVQAQQAALAQQQAEAQAAVAQQQVVTQPQVASPLADQMLAAWFSDAGFVGNSVSVGFASYAKKQYGNYFANTTMMAKESYSFRNDAKGKDKYKISLNGQPGRAKDLIARAGLKKVFINMGTNDLCGGADSAYATYADYINEIRATNPGILIFIEATTPVYASSEKDALNNKNIDALNAKMAALCATSPDLFFVDINTPMKDAKGGLNPAYCSDKFVHVNNAGYSVWTNTVLQYVRTMYGL